MRLEQYNCICVLTQVGVCARLTCLSICLLFKTSVQNCTHIHTGLKRLWERAFGRNINREGKKIKRTRESKTQHTYVHVNASYERAFFGLCGGETAENILVLWVLFEFYSKT